ncbi:sugar fermentation stimulation protein A [Desulfuromusa kysingii]|uniref:Sugar fermentation stimulation protein homolog n=1 Tax=Desulfuromusa kysingii TaxID=37625 RepID=A0A1H4C861_9BACT|nr:DNA/RNA nuclease SfsA [Desulfuromusa kysingii]SEA56574.1 sugar fermentation stimulation protein A [Desulfuromusa kysingii]
MDLPAPLLEGTLLRRYKRFFTDIELADGRVVTAHTPNTGSMKQCALPGSRVLISRADNPQRKLKYTLELIMISGRWVDTHTLRTNRVVEEALRHNQIQSLENFQVQPEYRFGESRIDFYLHQGDVNVLLEVKNVTLCCQPETACFPDAVTTRGQKHLRELLLAKQQGCRAIIFFLVQRSEAKKFSPADAIDPEYGRLLREVVAAGVEVLAYKTVVTPKENRVGEPIPVVL